MKETAVHDSMNRNGLMHIPTNLSIVLSRGSDLHDFRVVSNSLGKRGNAKCEIVDGLTVNFNLTYIYISLGGMNYEFMPISNKHNNT